MTGVFAVACIFVLLALKMQDSQIERMSSGRDLTYNFYMFCKSPVFVVLSLVAAIGAIAWFVMCRVKKIDESTRIFTSANCLTLVIYLAFFTLCFGVKEGSTNHGFFIAATIVLAALYYVSKLYNPDFVVYTAVTAVFAVSIYMFALYFEPSAIIIKVLITLVAAAGAVYANKRIRNLKVSKKRKASFLTFPVYVSLAIGAVCLFIRLIPGINIARIAMLALLLAQYIVFAIVYTIRLIKE